MKERRKIFSAADLAAVRDGRKTMFREMVRKQKHPFGTWATPEEVANEFNWGTNAFAPPLGTIGNRLWLPETWAYEGVDGSSRLPIQYKVDRSDWIKSSKWRSAAVMHRGACRTFAEITAVRVERVREITEEDAKAEGVNWKSHVVDEASGNLEPYEDAFDEFKRLWQSHHANWDANPWVWVYSIKLIKP